MKHLNYPFVILFSCLLILTACSPHPGTGVWSANAENKYGLSKIIIAFNGRAEFTTTRLMKTKWHCFWGKKTKTILSLDCSPASNPEQSRKFTIVSLDKMSAELREAGKPIATLKRVDENPVLTK